MYGQAFIPNDWEEGFCCYEVYWPNSPQWLAVLRGVLIMPAQGRFWDENTGTITEAQEVIRQTFDDNLHLREVIMPCSSDVANALLAIAASLQNAGGGGCGSTGDVSQSTYCYSGATVNVQGHVELGDGSNWPIFGTEPIITLGEGEFPAEYGTLENYQADKCRKANKMADDWITTLRNVGNTNWTAGVIGAALIIACIAGLIVVPPAAIPLLLFALTANIGITAVVVELANEIEANREEVVCILYEGTTVEVIIQGLSDFLDGLISLIGTTTILATALKSIALWFVSANTLNFLFSAEAMEAYPDADCSGCLSGIPTIEVVNEAGDWIDSGIAWGEEFTFNPVLTSGFRYLSFRLQGDVPNPLEDYTLEVTAITWNNNGSCSSYGSTPGTYAADVFPGLEVGGWLFGCSSTVETSITGVFHLPV